MLFIRQFCRDFQLQAECLPLREGQFTADDASSIRQNPQPRLRWMNRLNKEGAVLLAVPCMGYVFAGFREPAAESHCCAIYRLATTCHNPRKRAYLCLRFLVSSAACSFGWEAHGLRKGKRRPQMIGRETTATTAVRRMEFFLPIFLSRGRRRVCAVPLLLLP